MRSPMLPTVGLLLIAACSDYNLRVHQGKTLAEDTAEDGVTGSTEDTLGLEEAEDDCFDEEYGPIAVATDESCSGVAGGWDWTIEWELSSFTTVPESNVIAYTPVIGQLTDDNGDGRVDEADQTDIAFPTYDVVDTSAHRVLRVVSGDDGSVHTVFEGVAAADGRWLAPTGGIALADVDSDGLPDILIQFYDGQDCYAGAVTPEGDVKWVDEDLPLDVCGNNPAVADLDGDGSIEVVYGARILSAADGTVLGEGRAGSGMSTTYHYPSPAVADLDGDGEVVVTGGGRLRIYDHRCHRLGGWSLGSQDYGGPAAIADFDGDGEPEIAVNAQDSLAVFEPDGTRLWSRVMSDFSGSTGAAAFDFDGDGRSEVVVADQKELLVLSGADGSVLVHDPTHDSGTCSEYPAIADVDGDGSAEIVVPNAGYDSYGHQKGIYVVGEVHQGWMGARPTWSQYAWTEHGIDDTLTVPASPTPGWPEPNTFRSTTALGEPGRDASALLAGVCNSRCEDGLERIVVRVGNPSSEPLPAGLSVDVYSLVAGTPVLLDSAETPDEIPPGQSSDGITFDLDVEYIPDRQLQVVVDEADGLPECDEDNNSLLIVDDLCP